MVAACETGVEERKCIAFNVMPFVYSETEPPELHHYYLDSALHI
jgi:hypothetical protein